MILQPPTLNTIRVARVCHVHPEGHVFDGVFVDTGDFCRNVQVLSPMAGTDFGFTSGIPAPEQEGWDENRVMDPERRNLLAVVATCSTGLLCLGFLYPQINHLSFTKAADPNRMIERTPSDLYRTTSGGAEFEQYHPGEAWFRMGEAIEHEDLTGRDFDARWQLRRNTETNPIITLWNRVRGAASQWARAIIEKQKIELNVNQESALITLEDGHITIKAATITIVGKIFHTGDNDQTGVHTDDNGIHTSSS